MDAAREDRLERLFDEARTLPPERRAAFLTDACGADAELRSALEALTSHADAAFAFADRIAPAVARTAAAFLGDPAAAADDGADPLVGRRVAHFEIVERLGAGGMGRVYRARDLRLDRTVALKLLPPHLGADAAAKRRFVHEARAASALDHPGICAIHEIGEAGDGQLFIAMAHYPGETLKRRIARGPLPLADALDYGAQMAEALQRAHDADIVHRDVKPANVVVTDRGQVKLVDFGIAKMTGADVTREGVTLGTVAYMSPEQTRGDAVDARTDLWSLGAVLYEMLTAQRPFRGDSDEALVHAIRHDEPRPLRTLRAEVPAGLAVVVRRCLEKDPARRYQRAGDLLADLRAVRTGRTVRGPSARRARLLRVAAPLGLLLLAGDTAQRGLAAGRMTTPEAARLARAAREVKPEAFALYLRSARVGDEARRMDYLEQAIARDSTFALAHAKLALSYVMIARDRGRAERAITTALALDATLSDAYDALGLLRMWLDRDWPAAEAAFRRAIELNPHSSLAHHELGQLFMRVGRCDEALAEERRAVLQNPGVGHFQSGLAEVHLYCGHYDAAIRELGRTLDLVRDSASTYFLLGDAHFYQGRYAEALVMYERSRRPPPGWAYAALGREREARARIDTLTAQWARGEADGFTAWHLARTHTSLGERSQAITWLERSYASGHGLVVYLKVHPHFAPLRGDPRYRALLRKVRLDD